MFNIDGHMKSLISEFKYLIFKRCQRLCKVGIGIGWGGGIPIIEHKNKLQMFEFNELTNECRPMMVGKE